jgi:hypothetical protein
MPFLRAFLISCLALPAHAGDLKLKVEGWTLRGALQGFEPRYAPPVRGHLTASEAPRKDPCVFVAGVRHCPLRKLPNG